MNCQEARDASKIINFTQIVFLQNCCDEISWWNESKQDRSNKRRSHSRMSVLQTTTKLKATTESIDCTYIFGFAMRNCSPENVSKPKWKFNKTILKKNARISTTCWMVLATRHTKLIQNPHVLLPPFTNTFQTEPAHTTQTEAIFCFGCFHLNRLVNSDDF